MFSKEKASFCQAKLCTDINLCLHTFIAQWKLNDDNLRSNFWKKAEFYVKNACVSAESITFVSLYESDSPLHNDNDVNFTAMNWYQCSSYCTTGARRWVFLRFFLTLASVGFIAKGWGKCCCQPASWMPLERRFRIFKWLIDVLWLEVTVGMSEWFNFFLRMCHLHLWSISPPRSSSCPSVSAVNLQMWIAFPCVMFLGYFNVVSSWGFFNLFTFFCHFFPISYLEVHASLTGL